MRQPRDVSTRLGREGGDRRKRLPTLAVLCKHDCQPSPNFRYSVTCSEIRNGLEIITGKLQALPLGANNQDPLRSR